MPNKNFKTNVYSKIFGEKFRALFSSPSNIYDVGSLVNDKDTNYPR